MLQLEVLGYLMCAKKTDELTKQEQFHPIFKKSFANFFLLYPPPLHFSIVKNLSDQLFVLFVGLRKMMRPILLALELKRY